MLRRLVQRPAATLALSSAFAGQARFGGHDHHDDGPKPMKAVDVLKFYIPPVPPRKTLPPRVLDDQRLARKARLEERKKRAAAKPKEHPYAGHTHTSSGSRHASSGNGRTSAVASAGKPGVGSGKTLSELGDRPGIPMQVYLQ